MYAYTIRIYINNDIHFLWMKVMKDSTEGHAVSPGCVEVCDLYPPVTTGDVLTPL